MTQVKKHAVGEKWGEALKSKTAKDKMCLNIFLNCTRALEWLSGTVLNSYLGMLRYDSH